MAKSDYLVYSEDISDISKASKVDNKSPTAASDSQTLTLETLCEELKIAVFNHRKYLHELEDTQFIAPPRSYLLIKRAMDISIGVLGLILLSPLFLVVALMIKLDSKGPVFFSQTRVGKNGKEFLIYKFRTMVVDAEKNTGPVWAKKNDPRLTNIGGFLRNSKIDEFPQFLNLIKGDMSLVGPRPERPHFVNPCVKLIPGYNFRMKILPGITGVAQLRNGYDSTAIDIIRKLRYDATYLKRMSLSMDIGLLFETFISVFKRQF